MAVGDFLISVPQITAVSGAIPEKIWSQDYGNDRICGQSPTNVVVKDSKETCPSAEDSESKACLIHMAQMAMSGRAELRSKNDTSNTSHLDSRNL
jgi:hypothetical protein